MKVHFDGPRRPARVAKLLRSELAAAGVPVGLAKAQDVAAQGFGYATYKELQSLAGREQASAWDEDCPVATVVERRRRQADALVRAGMERLAAEEAVERIRPSGRTLGGAAGRAVAGDGGARPAASVPTPGKHSVVPREPMVDGGLDEVAEILRSGVYALTAEGGTIPLQEGQRRYVAALDDGTLLISKAHRATGPVSAAQALLQRSSYRPSKVLLVDLEVIRQIYEADARRRRSLDDVAPAIEFMALVREAAGRKANNLHVVVEAEGTNVFLRGAGREWPLPGMGYGDGLETCRNAFDVSADRDNPYNQYKPHRYQGARVVGEGLPHGVQAVSLQFNPLPRGGRQLIASLHYDRGAAGPPAGGLRGLGYTAEQERLVVRMRRRVSGINLIAGPPGSGRFTSLGRIVSEGIPGRSVVSVGQTRPDGGIPGVTEFPPEEKLTEDERSDALRQAVAYAIRSNPDVLLMGDIRDRHAADHAWMAACRGMQVWAMVPAGDAMKAFEHLRNEGVELHRLADHTIVNGIVAQRLVRKLCPHCALHAGAAVRIGCQDAGRVEELSLLGAPPRFARPGGCGKCEDGRSGRTLVAEVLVPDQRFMELLGEGKRNGAREHWLENLGGRTMLEGAAQLVVDGVLDPDEVERVVGLLDEVSVKRLDPPSGDGAGPHDPMRDWSEETCA